MRYFFETIKCEDYQVFHLKYHQQRIAKTIGLNIDLQEYIYPPNHELYRAKVIYTQEGISKIDYFPYAPKKINSFKFIYDDTIEYSAKYLDRTALDKLYSFKENTDEIIIIKNKLICDTSIANLAIWKDNRWLTPKKPLLEGTTRQRYLNEKKIYEADISIEDFKKASKIGLMNAMIDFLTLESFQLKD